MSKPKNTLTDKVIQLIYPKSKEVSALNNTPETSIFFEPICTI